jgi:hypothetical protein
MVTSYLRGRDAALIKLGLAPSNMDTGLAATERGQDIPPDAVVPPMSHVPGDVPAVWGGEAPLRLQLPTASSPHVTCSPETPEGAGSTVGGPLPGDPSPETNPSIRALSG